MEMLIQAGTKSRLQLLRFFQDVSGGSVWLARGGLYSLCYNDSETPYIVVSLGTQRLPGGLGISYRVVGKVDPEKIYSLYKKKMAPDDSEMVVEPLPELPFSLNGFFTYPNWRRLIPDTVVVSSLVWDFVSKTKFPESNIFFGSDGKPYLVIRSSGWGAYVVSKLVTWNDLSLSERKRYNIEDFLNEDEEDEDDEDGKTAV